MAAIFGGSLFAPMAREPVVSLAAWLGQAPGQGPLPAAGPVGGAGHLLAFGRSGPGDAPPVEDRKAREAVLAKWLTLAREVGEASEFTSKALAEGSF